MLAKSDPDAVELHPDAVVGHPVIRTLYDHLDEITCLEFHPREQILISGSRDTNIKMFDFSKTSAKKAFKTLTVRFYVLSTDFFYKNYIRNISASHTFLFLLLLLIITKQYSPLLDFFSSIFPIFLYSHPFNYVHMHPYTYTFNLSN